MDSRSNQEVIADNFEQTGNIHVHTVGMVVSKETSYTEWAEKGKELDKLARISEYVLPWLIGDWVVAGEELFDERYAQAVDFTGYTYGRIANCAWVARRVPINMRKKGLTFAHHEAICSLPNEERDRWLEMAVERFWTVRELKAHAKYGIPLEQEPPPRLLGRKAVRKSQRGENQTLEVPIISSSDAYSEWWDSYSKKSMNPQAQERERRMCFDAWEAARREYEQ